ncbi:MAG TPA: DUF177 domain-containing protein [Candidatus Polarisedimenticolaceae bacterium]|nr:DUF177 domain-containing protein [Candidatus Polarisedimenticolaceae bacterium]
MLIDIHKVEPEGIRFDTSIHLAPLPLEGPEQVEVLQAHVHGDLRRGADGVDFRGALEARVRMSCNRCLDAVELPIAVEFHLILVPNAVELGASDDGSNDRATLLFHAEGGQARLEEIVREQIYLQVPLKSLCRPDCAGLCPTCGVNRNRLECACRSEETDPRLAPLLELKKKLEQH